MALIEEFKKTYNLKGIGKPEYYLGGDIQSPLDEHWTSLGINTAISAQTYIKNSVDRFEKLFDKNLPKAQTPMAEKDHPELDDSPLSTYNLSR